MPMSSAEILIVDDNRMNITVLVEVLRDEYRLRVANNGEQALKLVESKKPDLILLDVMMPDMDGYQVSARLRSRAEFRDIPVIFLTALDEEQDKVKAFEVGAVDYVTKPFERLEVKARVRTHIALKQARERLSAHNQTLEQIVQQRTHDLRESRLEVIMKLSRAADFRDDVTGLHIQRVGRSSALLARELGLDSTFCEEIGLASPMHDVGKIGIPDSVLKKPAVYNDEERAIMQTHTLIGAEILSDGTSSVMRMAERVARSHHEHWNGNGYPQGISGEDIPIEGRITAICDVFDALTSTRPYKDAWPDEKARDYICEASGEQFSPECVDAFASCYDEISNIRHTLV